MRAFTFAPMLEHQISVFEAWLGGGYISPERLHEGHLRSPRRVRHGRCTRCRALLEFGIFTFTNDVRRRFDMPPLQFCIDCHEGIRALAGQLVQIYPADVLHLIPAWPTPKFAAPAASPERPHTHE